MRGGEHVAIGVSTTAVVLYAVQSSGGGVDVGAIAAAVGMAAVGSLAPDLDHRGSLASMTIPAALIVWGSVFLGARAWESAHPGAMPPVLTAMGAEWVARAWFIIAVGLALLLGSWLLGSMFGHRGIVHSVAFGTAASAIVAVGLASLGASTALAIPFAWGWLAHLIADSTTKAGLRKMLWPLFSRS